MVSIKPKHIIVVVGMHRSGTSMITRGLQALGVYLGDRTLPGAEDNQKGFFEDADVMAFNNELLKYFGLDWQSLKLIDAARFQSDSLRDFKRRAVTLLQAKFIDKSLFGVKDPRLTRLIPFWLTVFAEMKLQVHYLICCRNPKSVADSLFRRNNFDAQKSYYLWLEHVVPSLVDTFGFSRLVVDYDRMLNHADLELQRVAHWLGVTIDPDNPQLIEYQRAFLDPALRHSHHDKSIVKNDTAVPAGVIQAYDLLDRLANDAIPIDSFDAINEINTLKASFTELLPILGYLADCEYRAHQAPIEQERAKLAERACEELREQQNLVVNWSKQLEQRLLVADELVLKRGQQIDEMSTWCAQQTERIEAADAMILDRGKQIDALSHEMQTLSQHASASDQTYVNLLLIEQRRAELAERGRDELRVQQDQIVTWSKQLEQRLHEADGLALARGQQIKDLSDLGNQQTERIKAADALILERGKQIESLSLALQTLSSHINESRQLYVDQLARQIQRAESAELACGELRDQQSQTALWAKQLEQRLLKADALVLSRGQQIDEVSSWCTRLTQQINHASETIAKMEAQRDSDVM